MNYQSSYDTGLKPFNHDKHRGKWLSSKDYFFACVGHAFQADAIMIMPMAVFSEIGIFAVIPYLIISAICVVPIVFMQSFLGQFSSTGFISVFRISPLFKGIGYVSLAINFATLTYYSVFSAIPLFYFFHSLRPTLPWSCEGSQEWMKLPDRRTSVCVKENNETIDTFLEMLTPSVEFFRNHLHIPKYHSEEEEDIPKNTFSIQLMLCTCIVWGVIAFVILKPVELIGRLIRYSFLAVIAIMGLCLVRFIFLPGAIDGLWEFLMPSDVRIFYDTYLIIPCMALSTLGPGWGSILTMASYNDFKTDIFKYSWVMCVSHFGVIIGIAFLSIFIKQFVSTISPTSLTLLESYDLQWMEFLSIATALTFLELPHFWSLLFFSMWILGSLNLLVIQLLSLLTSLFDEFEDLREIKKTVTLGAVGVLALTSILYCSTLGLYFMSLLSKNTMISQIILNMFLLFVVLWIYGRERFQRDLNFMTSRVYSTWMVNMVRFVAPIFILLGLLIALFFSLEFGEHLAIDSMLTYLFGTFLFLLSWCLIPGYCICKIKNTTGIIGMRLRKSIRPTDWYPADPVYKQRYEELHNSTDISHQLTTVEYTNDS